MAIRKNNNLRGKVGGIVFRKRGNKTIVCAAPRKRSTYAKTTAEMKVHLLFKKHSRYATAAIKDEILGPLYASYASRSKTSYKLAFNDAANTPEISSIDASNYTGEPGSEIIVHAFDDFMVKELRVDIVDGKNNCIESGFAIAQTDDLHWKYTAQKTNPHLIGTTIAAHAFDHPHNSGSLEVIL